MDDENKKGIDKKRQNRKLQQLEKRLHFTFSNKSLLKRALTHRSYVNESSIPVKDNERLEYLGDSVLGLVVNEYLFKSFENYPEGDLAKIKSAVVSEETLAKVANQMNLGDYLIMGRGEELTGGRYRQSILADALEAIIGAVYLDAGLTKSKKLVLRLLKKDIQRIDKLSYLRDPKTTLQEIVQKKYKSRPLYTVIHESGPDHSKMYTIKLTINDRDITIGTGSSKQKAESDAAKKALELIYSNRISI
ncbi:MAG: ribonuclease III [Spirochaetota bacterium]